MENMNQAHTNDKLTPIANTKIRTILTDGRFAILKVIYDNPNIQHKTLCEKINKSANNLSNILKKINSADPNLILTVKNGTEKYYSLTPIARQYVEQEFTTYENSSQNSASIHVKYVETFVTNTLEALSRFKEKCGINWRTTLYGLLNEKNVTSDIEIKEIYRDLLNILYQCRMQNNDALQKIFDMLEDEDLINQIKNHLNAKFFYFDYLKPLLTFEKPNSTAPFKMIDNIFSELHPLVFPPNQYEEIQKPILASEEYNNLLIGIIKLTSEFINKDYSKSDAVSTWQSAYFLTEELAFYIAEKCSFLTLLHRFNI